MQIQYEVDWVMQLSRNLNIFVDNLDNLSVFYEESLDLIEERTDELFKSKGQSVQKWNKWAPLADSTVKARERRWGYYKNAPTSNPGPLRWTGNLQESRTRDVNDIEWSLTMDAYYAVYHHRGGKNLPERSVLDFDNKTNQEIIRALQKHIRKEIWIYGRQL